MGGKVQAMLGFADHVTFRDPQHVCGLYQTRPASPCVQARQLLRSLVEPWPSNGRNACTVAHASGTALARPHGQHRQHRIPRRSRRPPLRRELITKQGSLHAKCNSHRRVRGHRSRPVADPGTDTPAPTVRRLKTKWCCLPCSIHGPPARLYEAAHLATTVPGSKVWLVSLRPEGKAAAGDDDRWSESQLRTGADRRPHRRIQRCAFHRGRVSPRAIAAIAESGPQSNAPLRRMGVSHARRRRHVCNSPANGLVLATSFKVSTRSTMRDDGSFEVLERVEGGRHQVSVCAGSSGRTGLGHGQSC